MTRARVARSIAESWPRLARIAAALVSIASGFAFGVSMAIGIP